MSFHTKRQSRIPFCTSALFNHSPYHAYYCTHTACILDGMETGWYGNSVGNTTKKVKSKVFTYSLSSVGPGADPCVQAVSPQVTISHPPSVRLPLLSTRLRLTSQPQSITAPWPVPGYTACIGDRGTKVWTTCARLLRGFHPSRIRAQDLLITSPTIYSLLHRATGNTVTPLRRLVWMHLWTFASTKSFIS